MFRFDDIANASALLHVTSTYGDCVCYVVNVNENQAMKGDFEI
jgi:energy-converting hydrogenase Eha subunit C